MSNLPRNDEPPDDVTVGIPRSESTVPSEAVRPLRVWTVFAIAVATFVLSLLARIPVVILLVWIHGGPVSEPSDIINVIVTPWGFLATELSMQLTMLAMWWLISSFGDRRARVYRAIGSTSLHWLAYPCFAWAALGALWLGELFVRLAQPLFGEPDSDLSNRMYGSMTWPSGIVFVLFIALVPAFVEELFFRGYMQRRLMARWRPSAAIPTVAVIFAAFHGSPLAALGVLPLGLCFGILAWRTGSLWPGIVCHAFVNGAVNLWLVGGGLNILPKAMPTHVYYIGLATTLVCLVASGWTLLNYRVSASERGEGVSGLTST